MLVVVDELCMLRRRVANLWKKLNCHVYKDKRCPRWGAKPKVKAPFKYIDRTWRKWTHSLSVLAVQCQLLVSPISLSLERHIHWSSMCVCRKGRDIVAKWLSGCRWDVGRSMANGCLCRSGCGIVTKWRSGCRCGHMDNIEF